MDCKLLNEGDSNTAGILARKMWENDQTIFRGLESSRTTTRLLTLTL